MTTPLPSALASPTWPLADAATFTTRTLTTEGRTEAIVFVAGDRGAASWLCASDRAVAANASVEFVCDAADPPTERDEHHHEDDREHREPFDEPTDVSPRAQRLVRRDVHLRSQGDTGVRAIGV